MKSNLTAVRQEIENLETYEKHGESYANADGRHGWRNPIREDTGAILESLTLLAAPKRILEIGTAHGLSALYFVAGLNNGSKAHIEAQKSLYHGQLLALLEKGLIRPGTLLLADNVNDRRAECEAFVAWFAEKGLLVCRLPDDFQN